MKRTCAQCQMPLVGRSDKKFCSMTCKNHFNSIQRSKTKTITQEVDNYLHRNREILATLMPVAKKDMFDKLILTKAGFRWEYCTGIYLNKDGKTYFIVYDYAWMAFSNQQILVVKKQLSK